MEITNRIVIRVIVCTICGLAACCVVTVCVLASFNIQIPPELNTLTGGLVGAISAMLVKTSPTASTPQDVNVTNPPEAPVPVETTK